MSEIVRRSSSRNAKLAKIPLGIAGRAAVGFGKKLAGGDKGEINAQLNQKAAEQLFTVLGELKGGAMKFGQALSVMEAAVPEEFGEHYREALTKLQAAAPPMPIETVHRVLDQQLGTQWRARFQSFDDAPAASASIGQVHRAVWSDGRTVAVKVQYPGADDALRADLKTLSRMTGLISSVIPGADVKPILAEITERTEEELDYRNEANNQRTFAKAYDGHPEFVVPKVVASAPKVIVTEWLDGTPVSAIIAAGNADPEGTRELRNRVATLMGRFHFSAPELAGLLHADPHPGNFMMTPDGKLAVIDFGACAPLPNGFPELLGRILALAVDEDFEELTALLHENGWVIPGRVITHQEIADYLRPFTDPIKSDSFHFTRKWMQRVAGRASDFNSPEMKTARALMLPAEHVMIFRVLAGSIGICAQLDAEVPFMQLAATWMPGFREQRNSA
ncbi:AarF/ABC1/UbiB kinase family protein [Nocardia cyriacigeorgica]|uniref:Aminoglycoside acetyltransferase regulator n=1 Tax=Nocardia cyriacigeorgica TaxID=135487 RepID=A0A4V6ICD3_9NOCA|nr:AarF/UbiB family protein [Nocardia cyriacigeorgica]MBF6318894.1 AarF/ABC1/UbiB kinase family protein [Nocardia cyriacigeorgica]MBF6344211.1 AarF/ABC1/UbiB kinase family protein [Nocardia cyriacigeorgica]MBF6395503.1 AarF/ABC1/UbiB kinase family protein [Nocardia cyriacigeorgica]MBF6401135.1 AarF/ABC1/UbiB kinase family protein [Nocardia cyriacigeorgica]MBF6531595.1 AarF/ABC1/UbiB kinase family protein [Nocardia cyriacigeorgica]